MLEDTLVYDFNIPLGTEFELINDTPSSCPICKDRAIALESAPFFSSDIHVDQLIQFMQEKYNITLTPPEVRVHEGHIKPVYDEELRNIARRDFALIESEIIRKVNEEDVIESTIRALHGRRLTLEKTGEYGREWVSVVQVLNKWVELKLKMEKKIEDTPATKIFFSDLAQGEGMDENDTGKSKRISKEP